MPAHDLKNAIKVRDFLEECEQEIIGHAWAPIAVIAAREDGGIQAIVHPFMEKRTWEAMIIDMADVIKQERGEPDYE